MANLKDLIVTGSSRLIGKVYAPGGIEGTASNALKVNNHTVDKDVPSNALFTDTTNLASMTGTLGVDHGGTGKTTGNDAANYFINQLSTGSSDPTDTDYYVAQYAGGGTTTTTYHRRPMSALWNYIKGKINTVLGLNADTYGGNAASATKATKDGSGNTITSYYEPKTNVISKGSATQPVYFDANGVAQNTTYKLEKSVPSDAKFTDTTYENATTTTAGLMSPTDKTKLDSLSSGGGGGQSDWQQNDSDDASYVINRTHWLEPHEPLSESYSVNLTSSGILIQDAQ